MKTTEKNDLIYEVQFEQLVEGKKEPINSTQETMNAQMDITVSMGSTRAKIEKIVNLKIGDVIELDKHVEEALDIIVNGKLIASGESIILDNKLAVKLAKIKDSDEDN
jgi:flagellar motor switch protein FliN/FliY